MANLKQLKLKRQSVNKTRKVTRAMEAVSAVKMQKAQELALQGRPFASVALRILDSLSFDFESSKHPLVAPKNSGKHGLLLVTSDKGLAGSLNSAVLKKASEFINTHNKKDIAAIAIGKRARDFLQRERIEILHFAFNNKDGVSLEDTLDISRQILKAHQEQNMTQDWTVAFMNFISTFEQKAIFRKVLPLSLSELKDLVGDVENSKQRDTVSFEQMRKDYLTDTDTSAILDEVIPNLLNVFVHHILLESKASEHSARMVAMKAATDKAGELSHELLLKFNKARQAAITREVSEITSGVEAMKDE